MTDICELLQNYSIKIEKYQQKLPEKGREFNTLKENLIWANTGKDGQLTAEGLINVLTSYIQFLEIYRPELKEE